MPAFDLLVRGGRCVLPGGVQDADVAVADGRIAAVGAPGVIREAAATLDAAGLLVLPGAIDAHVHVRDPGQTHKEDYASATRAAASSGVTTIVSQPNTIPAPTTLAGLQAVLEAARQSRVDHAVCAGVVADQPDGAAARELAAAGVVGFEVLGDTGALDGDAWLRLFEAVAPTGLPLSLLAADRALMRRNERLARALPGSGWRAFSRLVSGDAEVAGFCRAVALARACRVPLIVRQVTTAAGLQALRRARQEQPDAPLWVEVNVHHLFLTDADLEERGPYAQMVPPPRPAADVEALWAGVRDGSVDVISTDHAPHTREEKEQGRADPWTAPTGIPGLDTFVPLLLDAATAGRLSWSRLVSLIAGNVARMHGLALRKGAIAVGADADLVLVDPDGEWSVDRQRLLSRCGWSAFEGRRGRGRPVLSLVRGTVVARHGRPTDEPIGQLLRGPAAA